MSLHVTKETTLWLGFLRARVGRKWNTEKRTVCETKLWMGCLNKKAELCSPAFLLCPFLKICLAPKLINT